jgi:hypothetical protein
MLVVMAIIPAAERDQVRFSENTYHISQPFEEHEISEERLRFLSDCLFRTRKRHLSENACNDG